MLKNLKKTKSEGFTIIEVMIVLAIAGLILLIVFLAVPALQRNSRNTQRKNDVASISSALSEYLSNNNGQLPAASCTGSGCTFTKNAKLGFYTGSSDIVYTVNAAQLVAEPAWSATQKSAVQLETYAKCNGNALDTTAGDASSRNVAIFYWIEAGGGGQTEQCIDS